MSQKAQLQQEFQNELITANQLLLMISKELQQIAALTNPGGEFEKNIVQNASLIKSLADLQKVDLDKIPPFMRKQIDMAIGLSRNAYEEHDTSNDDSQMKESQ